jgi:hypothetical protein
MQIEKVTTNYVYVKLMNYTSDPKSRYAQEYRWSHKQVKGWVVHVDQEMSQEDWTKALYPAA